MADAQAEIARLTRERDAWKQRALYEEESRLTLVKNLFRTLAEHGETDSGMHRG